LGRCVMQVESKFKTYIKREWVWQWMWMGGKRKRRWKLNMWLVWRKKKNREHIKEQRMQLVHDSVGYALPCVGVR